MNSAAENIAWPMQVTASEAVIKPSVKVELCEKSSAFVGAKRTTSLWDEGSPRRDDDLEQDAEEANEKYIENFRKRYKFSNSVFSNVGVVGAIVYPICILCGTLFYMFTERLDVGTSFFTASEIFLAVGFGVPGFNSNYSYIFSAFLIIAGSLTTMGILNHFFQEIMFSNAQEVFEHHQSQMTSATPLEDCLESETSDSGYIYEYIPLVLLIILCATGIICAMCLEDFEFWESVFFVISALSSCGDLAPNCIGNEDDCTMGWSGFLWGFFIIFGVPMYALSLSRISYMIIQPIIRNNDRQVLLKPWNNAEYYFATTFLRSRKTDKNTSLAEFDQNPER